MTANNFDLDKLHVASPCSVAWESMNGDERRRHCELCGLNVYNISGMTRGEAKELIENREGRLCVRLYRRADGTLITKDCPVGARALRKRVASFAGAALAAVLGLFSVSYGQETTDKPVDASKVKMVRTVNPAGESEVTGTITDEHGALIPGAKVELVGDKHEMKAATNYDGEYRFAQVPRGVYSFRVSWRAFHAFEVINLKIGEKESVRLDATLKAVAEEVVGDLMVTEEPIVDVGTTNVKTKITARPFHELPARGRRSIVDYF